MRRTAVEMAALTALLLGGALAYGQPATPPAATPPAAGANKPKEAPAKAPAADTPPAAGANKPKEAPAKSKLEEMLDKALRDNPDLRLAAAKVAEAEAELNRARLLVVQKVAAQYQAVEAEKAAVESAAVELQETQTLYKSNTVPLATFRAAEQKLLDAKAKLAALETEMPYLLGKQPEGGIGAKIHMRLTEIDLRQSDPEFVSRLHVHRYGRPPTADEAAAAARPKSVIQGPTADRIRAALDKPFTLDLKETVLSDVIANVSGAFEKANPGLLIKCNISQDILDKKVSVQFDKMPFGAVLVWIEDSVPSSGVVVRDYGLVIDMKPHLPPGAPSLHDFWKSGKAEEKAPEKDQSSNPPAKHVEGVVKSVGSDVVQISIGSDDGLAMGNTLWVYRLNVKALAQSKYLGRIKIVGLDAKSAIGEPMGKMAGPIQEGDHVYSRILGD
jgi:hypothetical protein